MDFDKCFEPGVYTSFGFGPNGAAVSQAISLKRIADALEAMAHKKQEAVDPAKVFSAEFRKAHAASPKR